MDQAHAVQTKQRVAGSGVQYGAFGALEIDRRILAQRQDPQFGLPTDQV